MTKIRMHEKEIREELFRVLSIKPAKEYNICKIINATQWVDAKKEADADPRVQKSDARHLFRELRRKPMWQCLLKLWNDGYTPAEAAKALKIPYATAYYYFKRFKNRRRPRDWGKESYRIKEGSVNDENEFGIIERIPEPYKEKKARLETKKFLISAAEEKRARKAAKLKDIFDKQQEQPR